MSRRLALRIVGVAALLVVALGVATLVMLPTLARWVVSTQLASATGRKVALDALELELFGGRAGLRGLRVIDRDGGPLLALERAEVRFSPRDLVRGHLRVTDATVQGTTARIVRTGPATFNISDLLGRRSEPGGGTAEVTIERFAFVGGAVEIEDRTLTPPRTWRVEGIELRARDASTVPGAPAGAATLKAVAAGSPVSVDLTDLKLAPLHFRAVVDAREIDASLAGLYLPPQSPLSPTRGLVSVSATVDHDAAAGTRGELEASFARVELHRPGQESAYLTAPGVRVKVEGLRVRPGAIEVARVAVDGGAIGLEDTRLQPVRRWQIDGVALEARNLSSAREAPPGVASARAATAGARLEVWVANARLAPLELHATAIVRGVDLALVRLYLPPDLPIHPERGVVNATVRVEHDTARGTRLGVDATLTEIALQRPATFVTAPAVRVTVDDIALDRGAVTVGRVSLTGDRLSLEERTAKPVRTWPVRDLVFEARDLSSRRDAVQGTASLRAVVAGASASVFVTEARLQPLEYRATTILRNADAHLFQLYLPADVPVHLSRGVVNSTIQVGHILAEGTRVTGDVTITGLEARGRGPLATLGVTSPSLRLAIAHGRRKDDTLSIGRVELSGAGVFTDSRGSSARFDLTELRLGSEDLTWPVSAPARVEVALKFRDRGELAGSGTARLTAPLPTIAWAAELALKFRAVDLAPLAAYVPAAGGLGGRVRADITATVAYAGALTARIRGDVGGARFAIAEGKQTLLSLRSINATGLDLDWPERMSIRQVRLRQPYGLVVRDPHGQFPLATRFAAPPREAQGVPAAPSAPAAAPGAARALPRIEVAEVVVESGSATFVDQTATPAARVELPKVDLTARDVTWPASKPIGLTLAGTFPEGGTVKTQGSVVVEPPSVDVSIAFQDALLAALQPYMPFRARVAGRLNATLTVAGPLTPPRLRIKGDVGLRNLDISDAQGSVLRADGLRIAGIDADWPTRIAFDRVRVRQSWALIERDARGGFTLRRLLERAPGAIGQSPSPPPPSTAAAPPPPGGSPPSSPAGALEFSFREGVFAGQSATIIDGLVNPPARIDVSDARLTVRDFVWPSRSAARVELTTPMPAGGRLDVNGTVQLEPVRIDVRAVLDAVAIEPAQPYLPIDGRVAGKVTGDLTMKLALEPVAIQVAGQARLQGFRLNDGDRAVVTVGRVDTAGIDVDWPKRIAFQRVLFRRPRLLVERDQDGEILLRRLVTPRWTTSDKPAPASGGRAAPSAPSAPAAPARPPVIEVASFALERASARFVDYGTTPDYAEEVEDLNVTISPLTTEAGRSTRFSATGGIGGGAFKVHGEGAWGDRPALDMKLELRDFVVPRANPYVIKHTAWRATNGTLNVAGSYALEGSRLDTRHDVLVRDLDVAPVAASDEVERRVGLPFGLLVSLLKDARGEIKLSLPVSGDLSSRDFDYREAVWGAVRSLSIRLLALPFSKIGSLFVSADSKVKAVALEPVVFEVGADSLGPEMAPHLERVADFLRASPAVKVVLEPILVEPDVQALKRGQTGAAAPALPPDVLRGLGTRRIEAVRQALARAGVDAARLTGTARRVPLVEARGEPRVEFDLRP